MQLREPVRWGVKSVGGLAANLALLTLWVDYLGIWPELAIGINWVLISIAGYAVTDRWVFREADSPRGVGANLKRYVGMQSVMAGGKAVNYVLYVGLMWAGVEYRVAWVVGAVVVFAATFTGNKVLWESAVA